MEIPRSSRIKEIWDEIRQIGRYIWKVWSGWRYTFVYWHDTLEQIYIMGIQALPLVLIASGAIGMVLTLEWGTKLEQFGAKLMLGRLVAMSVIREIGPTFTGLMLAGRSGAKLVSELGNMVLSEQVDALRAFGTDPVKRLIIPRVFASTFLVIPLTIIADIFGIMCGWFCAVMWMGVDSTFFWVSVQSGLVMKDLIVGIIKPPFFGMLIGMVACYLGITVRGGTIGLGRAATLTVMLTSISVLLMDFIITKLVVAVY